MDRLTELGAEAFTRESVVQTLSAAASTTVVLLGAGAAITAATLAAASYLF